MGPVCGELSCRSQLIDMLVSHDEQISRFRHGLWAEEPNHITRAH